MIKNFDLRVECVKLKITNDKEMTGSIISSSQDGYIKYWEINKYIILDI
jgi:hypothetical protein